MVKALPGIAHYGRYLVGLRQRLLTAMYRFGGHTFGTEPFLPLRY